MIKNLFYSFFFIFIIGCGNIELVLKESNTPNPLKNNVLIVVSGEEKERYLRELYSFFGSNKGNEYVLTTSFVEKKENKVVRENQVAEKIDYELIIDYNLSYQNQECKILNKKIITKFTSSPKSFGYNFGAYRSFEKLYSSSIRRNIQIFISSIPIKKECLK